MAGHEDAQSSISGENSLSSPVALPATQGKPSGLERAQSRWITVEPVIVLGMMGYTCIALVKPFFIKDRISHLYNYTESNDTQCGGLHPGNDTLGDKIQSESSMWLLYLSAASGIPAMLSTIVFCTMSDRLGRKIAMALPALGFAIQAAVYGFTIHFKLPLAVLFVGDAIQGLTGGFGLLFAGCISYLTDATSKEQRTMRIVIAEMLTFLVGGTNQLGQGYLITFGYLPSLAIAFGCNAAALLYLGIPWFVIETIEGSRSDRKEFLEVWRRMKRLLEFNENGRRWQMLLLDFFIFFVVGQTIGFSSILVLYGTAKPFCWTPATAGIASALGFILLSFGMLIGTKVFSLCLGDYWLMQISSLSLLATLITTALAQTTLVINIGSVLGSLRGISVPVARTVLSTITHPNEIGAVFSIVGCLESLSLFVFSLAATSLYASTIMFLPPLTFYVFSGVTVIPIGMTLLLQLYWPRQKKYTKIEVNVNEN
ncbi:proton-coupled folate transporter-like [Patiria miniata]|uniref:Proton-coupled folate transporter n=1 Tax=Patiria miniata TaxID=46514 RepID=A0A914B7U6_PATMI|nr:proton-coupled folate transporter-like [Patiria miniata]